MHTHTHCIKSEAAKLQSTLTTLLSCSSRTVSIQDAVGQSEKLDYHIDDMTETTDKTDNGRDTGDIAELQLENCKHTRHCWAIREATASH